MVPFKCLFGVLLIRIPLIKADTLFEKGVETGRSLTPLSRLGVRSLSILLLSDPVGLARLKKPTSAVANPAAVICQRSTRWSYKSRFSPTSLPSSTTFCFFLSHHNLASDCLSVAAATSDPNSFHDLNDGIETVLSVTTMETYSCAGTEYYIASMLFSTLATLIRQQLATQSGS